jgi:hypothetical protein
MNAPSTISTVHKLIKAGLRDRDIQVKAGVTYDVVRYHRRAYYPQTVQRNPNRGKKIDWSVNDAYLDLPTKQAAKIIGCDPATVQTRKRKLSMDSRIDHEVLLPCRVDVNGIMQDFFQKCGCVTHAEKSYALQCVAREMRTWNI